MRSAHFRCHDATPGCTVGSLCESCVRRALPVAARQAGVIGQCWAERVARHREHRGHEAWPDTERARAIAARLVQQLVQHPAMVRPLVEACVAGAVAWWARRPAMYRR